MIYFRDVMAFSHKNKREKNEDVCGYLIGEGMLPDGSTKAGVFFVADGVSNANGEEAARRIRQGYRKVLAGLLDVCVDMQEKKVQGVYDMDEDDIYALLKDAIRQLDQVVRGDEYIGKYGATISLALVLGCFVYTANLGDSPMLLVKLDSYGQLPEEEPITELYRCQNNAGDLPEELALVSPYKNVLSGPVLGDDPPRQAIYTTKAGLAQNNLLLLGSDGALSVLRKKDMLQLLDETISDGLRKFNDALFSAVRAQKTGDDNYTLIGVQILTD